MNSTSTIKGRYAEFAIVTFVALKIAALLILAWNRRFVMDEFAQFGWSKYIPGEIGWLATQYPKAEGYAFLFYPAHSIGWNARSMLLLGRMEMSLLACATLAIVYGLARSLGETKERAALIVLILLSFSNFIERVFETRGDPLSVFFAAAALLVTLRGRDRSWWIFAAGVLSGLAFVSTQKAIYFNVALGVALVGDAALDRRFVEGTARGAWLVLGWLVPIVIYCVVLGEGDPLVVGHNLFLGPIGAVSPQIADEYGGLMQFVVQTLVRNALLYLYCFAGMAFALLRLPRLDSARRVALIFSVIVTALVFAHNQPWPYVFIMALPFMALWALWPFDALASKPLYLRTAGAVLAVAIAASFAKNLTCLRIGNRDQLALVDRAEALLGPNDVYFDGVGMLPNRPEPSTFWLDRHAVLATLREEHHSEAYRIFTDTPPKMIIWSYRMDAIEPIVEPLIHNSYVQIAPNIRIAGSLLRRGETVHFNVPIPGTYGLYDLNGEPLSTPLAIDGAIRVPVTLPRGSASVALLSGPAEALLLPKGEYAGKIDVTLNDKDLFANVYN